ncbi:MAG: DUF393 domain-containing protein [Phycisphaeraceae bacterium]|nr:DUF393 domain-containing protein [Phycisphaerales bacterium]QOJ17098.1 MAG: DUF393 domain-containing protein [Phycisphaeraceae bacterium]
MWSPPDDSRTLVLIYDGRCAFCERNSARLVRWVRRGSLVRVSSSEPGVLERYPSLTREQCDRAMQLVLPDGRIVSGAQAAAEALKTRRWTGWLASVYYLPGLRWVFDRLYNWVARNRYRFSRSATVCTTSGCAVAAKRP